MAADFHVSRRIFIGCAGLSRSTPAACLEGGEFRFVQFVVIVLVQRVKLLRQMPVDLRLSLGDIHVRVFIRVLEPVAVRAWIRLLVFGIFSSRLRPLTCMLAEAIPVVPSARAIANASMPRVALCRPATPASA